MTNAKDIIKINVTTTEYDGNDFPEADRYVDYLADQLSVRYPGAAISAAFGTRDKVFAYDENGQCDFAVSDDLLEDVKTGLWDEFCSNGYKDYSEETDGSTQG